MDLLRIEISSKSVGGIWLLQNDVDGMARRVAYERFVHDSGSVPMCGNGGGIGLRSVNAEQEEVRRHGG